MAISAAATMLGVSPHSFHGGNADLLRRPSSMMKCPFMRAFLSLKATFRASPSPIQAISVMSSPDVHQNGSQNQHLNTLFETEAEISRVSPDRMPLGFPQLDTDSNQVSYTNRKSSIMVVGLSVHSAPVEMREKLAVSEADWVRAVEELSVYPHIEEAAILSTCNRFEIYVSALSWHMGMVEVLDWMSHRSGIVNVHLRQHVFVLQNQDASKHLFRVASGLDSLVLGEGQILSQVKQVMQIGQSVKGFGRQLTGLFKQAIVSGKRVRSETSIGAGAVSISSAAVELADKKVCSVSLKDASVCIVGAGKMAKLLIKHLMSKGCNNMVVLNRSEERVQELQRLFSGAVITFQPLQQLTKCIEEADIMFTCTASDTPLIDKSMVEGLPCTIGEKYFVDISVPRNVSSCVQELACVSLYNVDDLEEVVAGNREERARKAIEAEAIIEEELKSFATWQDSLETVPTIKKLRAYAERIRLGEVEKCLGKMGDGLSSKDKKLVDELSRTIVNKLLHGPMVRLRGDGSNSSCRTETLENIHAVERMFNLNAESNAQVR